MSTGYVFGINLQMTTITCCREGCGLTFAVPEWWDQKRREDHTTFYCPNGHKQHFGGPTNLERRARELASKLERVEAELERSENRAEAYRRSASARKGQITKIKNRIAKGICPVAGCKRSGFSNVQSHIHQKHPDWHMPEEDA